MSKKKYIEKNPFKIIYLSLPFIISKPVIIAWFITTILLSICYLLNPKIFNMSSLKDIAISIIGFLGITISILSLRAYNNQDLMALYEHNRNHSLYYKYISEYILAVFLWLLACIATIFGSILNISLFPQWANIASKILFIAIILLNIFSVFDIFIKSINRLSNKVYITSKKNENKNNSQKNIASKDDIS